MKLRQVGDAASAAAVGDRSMGIPLRSPYRGTNGECHFSTDAG